jgi:Fe-S-cluster containining protein
VTTSKTIKIVIDENVKNLSLPEKTISSEKEMDKANEKISKFHLPILKINDPAEWPSLPLEQRKHLTDELATKTCLENCCGINGLKSGCCTMDPDHLEHLLGPINGDDEKWLEDIIKHFRARGLTISRSDVVIDYEEGVEIGKSLFNDNPAFRDKSSYPILRMQVYGQRYVCKFLNPNSGKCSIYKMRPIMCRNYTCQYIKSNFLVRTSEKPNVYKKLR